MEAGGWVVVGEGVIDGHILEEGLHVLIKECLDMAVVVGGVDKNGADVSFYYIWEALSKWLD